MQVLETQYNEIETSKQTRHNIASLKDSKTFTFTTGHQLNIFTGPVYFIYKIVSIINLCRIAKQKYPQHHFVPIFWMASEDHDFEEINHIYIKNKCIEWQTQQKGAVGRMNTDSIKQTLETLQELLPKNQNTDALLTLFQKSYLQHQNLSQATRFLVNELFKNEGLVILDADDATLKKQLIPIIKKEIHTQIAEKNLQKTAQLLSDYHTQVNPREINFFYLDTQQRNRLVQAAEGTYEVLNTTLKFSTEQLEKEIESHPEKFSPNVIYRPVYQELVLPNLAYVGGGGELAYWLQLKPLFDALELTFPMLILRNSVVVATEKQERRRQKLQLTWQQLFSKTPQLTQELTEKLDESSYSFKQQKKILTQQFEELKELSKHTHSTFRTAIDAQCQKQINGLEKLEKRYYKALRLKHSEEIQLKTKLKDELFPADGLQERKANFSEFYSETGDAFIRKLLTQLHPLEHHFEVVII